MTKPAKRNISGVLLLDKPLNISSNKAIQVAKHLFSAAKCGHTGTLDPLATGLLPVCFGEATKFSSVLLGANKTYETTLKLGFMSTTGDAEGEISQVAATVPNPAFSKCEHAIQDFIGPIMQTPPMYSALKHQGKPLYAYARNGEDIERQAREVIIHGIQIQSLLHNELQLTIQCGTGTYIRTLAEDIGKALGYGGAYLLSLRRTAIDRFPVSQAHTLSALEEINAIERDACLLPVDCLLQAYPAVTLDDQPALLLQQGRTVEYRPDSNTMPAGEVIRLYNRQHFIGLGEITAKQEIMAKRLLSNSYWSEMAL
ncbi:tRNA pseudouridine(55) synthase TruB [Nitrosomonas oligotropha]|uniref:tRNA pseudouridine(55) synthase TruB n=1 Tax=Nitrosomonas oligotropha TaxID=42354 RepID=UPI00136FD655|nr:tRNA pseudouridine(55) synthase TruB [Nitrosomonas oligotropha]MXS84093.1 tRNA pseudouridine(55) synthase TruB [Nitrosomonas oligotropha]